MNEFFDRDISLILEELWKAGNFETPEAALDYFCGRAFMWSVSFWPYTFCETCGEQIRVCICENPLSPSIKEVDNKEMTVCDICGYPMDSTKCKLKCPNCGATRD